LSPELTNKNQVILNEIRVGTIHRIEEALGIAFDGVLRRHTKKPDLDIGATFDHAEFAHAAA
jgi:hypothetical protein